MGTVQEGSKGKIESKNRKQVVGEEEAKTN